MQADTAAADDGLSGWFEAHPLAHLVYDPVSLRVLAANRAALERYGYRRDELLAMTRRDLLWPDQWPALEAFIAGLPGTTSGPQRVWRERTKAGGVLLSDVRSMPALHRGRPARLAVFMDAGPRTRLEAEVIEQRDRLAATLAAIPDLWFILDADQRCAEVSDPGHPSLSVSWEQQRGRPYGELVDPSLAVTMQGAMAQARATGQPQSRRYRMTLRTGESRDFEARTIAMSEGRCMVLVRDVSEATRLEEALRGRALAEDARRRQAEFLSRMSHELRTPLNAILGFGHLLGHELAPGSPAGRQLAHIVTAGEQMLALVDELLQLRDLQHRPDAL